MAYQLQFACSKDAVPRLSGGDETRAILLRHGYTLVDLRNDASNSHSDDVQVNSATKFWWANQSQNLIRSSVTGLSGLRWLGRTDIVFHYDSPELRAVSRVATAPQLAYSPRGYLESSTKSVGNLILVEPVREVRVGRNEVLEELESGVGPVNADCTLRRGYFFPVSRTAGLAVLGLTGLKPVEKLQDSGPEMSLQLIQGSSDRLALTAVRAEQRFLRRQQIQRWAASVAFVALRCRRNC